MIMTAIGSENKMKRCFYSHITASCHLIKNTCIIPIQRTTLSQISFPEHDYRAPQQRRRGEEGGSAGNGESQAHFSRFDITRVQLISKIIAHIMLYLIIDVTLHISRRLVHDDAAAQDDNPAHDGQAGKGQDAAAPQESRHGGPEPQRSRTHGHSRWLRAHPARQAHL